MLLQKICRKLKLQYIKLVSYISVKKYMTLYTKYLQDRGVNIADYNGLGYIDTKCHIDGARYSYITIGKEVTISKDTTLLVHDFFFETNNEAT